MRTVIYNDDAAPWSRSNHLMGTRLLPLSDDSNNFCGALLWNPWRTRTEKMVNQAIFVTRTV
jgi:hypothetical protein